MAWIDRLLSRKEDAPPVAPIAESTKETTYLGPAITIKGNIAGTDHLRFFGRLQGDVLLEGDLAVEASARIDGNVRADRITVSGIVEGGVGTSEGLQVRAQGKIRGRLQTKFIEVERGAVIDGSIEMSPNL